MAWVDGISFCAKDSYCRARTLVDPRGESTSEINGDIMVSIEATMLFSRNFRKWSVRCERVGSRQVRAIEKHYCGGRESTRY